MQILILGRLLHIPGEHQSSWNGQEKKIPLAVSKIPWEMFCWLIPQFWGENQDNPILFDPILVLLQLG